MINFKEEFKKLSIDEKRKMAKILKTQGAQYNVYPLSSEQERMWFLYMLDKSNPYYNVTFGIKITGFLNDQLFEQAVQCLLKRHKAFTT